MSPATNRVAILISYFVHLEVHTIPARQFRRVLTGKQSYLR